MSEIINPMPDTDIKTGKFFNKNWVKLILSAVCWVILALFSIFLILKSVYAFCWIFMLLFANFVIMAIILKKSKVIKIISVNIAILCILLAGVEAMLHHSNEPDIIKEGSYYNKKINVYNINDRILGFRPEAGRCVTARKSVKNGEIIFDAIYTIEKNGWRITPKVGPNRPSILFFGGSFTFGEGLNDNENFPWLTGQMTGYRIYNFGFHGYGPHQMLAGIESGIFDKIIRDSKPEYAFYTAIPNHPERSAGWAFWDTYGPEYVMDADNSVRYKGNFHGKITSYILKGLSRSKIYIGLRDACKVQSRQYNVKLAAAIVKQAQKVLSQKYPGIKFQVIYWGQDDDFFQELKKNGLDTIMINQLIPDYFKEKEKYVFIYDGHPNKVASKLVAKGITAKVSGLKESDKRKNKKTMISNFKFRQFVFKLLTPMVRFNDWQIDHIGLYNGEQRLKRLSIDQADQLIADKINSGEPFTVARYGHTEFCCIMKVGRQSYWRGRLSRTGVHSGIYPDWENLYLEASNDVDILAVWNYRTNYLAKKKLVKNLPNISHFVPLKYSNPFGEKKWINALENKKILVIHPFVKSIEQQNTKREQIGILPEFKQLEIIKPVVSYVNTESQFDWFGALHSMQDEIAKKDFEIALIGCGPYGFPLATYVKSLGKQAIHLGGVTQLLFGIKGKRWFNEPGFAETVNEYWITPLEEDIPPRLREIENGCYIG